MFCQLRITKLLCAHNFLYTLTEKRLKKGNFSILNSQLNYVPLRRDLSIMSQSLNR